MPNSAGDQGTVGADANKAGFAGQPFGGGPFETFSAYQIATAGLMAGGGRLQQTNTAGQAIDLWIGGSDAGTAATNANGGSTYIQCGLPTGSGTAGSINYVKADGTVFATLANDGSLTITTGTITASTPGLNLSQTWNSGAVTFSGVTVAITDTASASGSHVFLATRGGTNWFSVAKQTLAAFTDIPCLSSGTASYRGMLWLLPSGGIVGSRGTSAALGGYLGADITLGTTGVLVVAANAGSGLKGRIGITASDVTQAEPDIFLSRPAAGVFGINNSTTVGGSFACTATTTAISANTDNLVLNASEFQRMNCTSACNLTGVAPPTGTSHVDGRVIELINVGTQNLTFKHNVTSTAANRFFCSTGADLVCAPSQRIRARYDSTGADNATQAGWRIFLDT